jgi:hypothetical protein
MILRQIRDIYVSRLENLYQGLEAISIQLFVKTCYTCQI